MTSTPGTPGRGAIRASEVRITTSWLVDCNVCLEAVEPESGNFLTRHEANEAKQRHLDEHRRGEYLPENDPHV